MKTRASLRGFTLVELAIVLVIVGLLIGTLMPPLSAQIDQRNANETQQKLNDARDALIGFAAVNGRLPCPAAPTTATGTAGAGVEYAATASGCTTSTSGVLPWITLGLPETDAWGRRFTYHVADDFAKTIAPGKTAAFDLATNGNINVLSTAGGSTVATAIPALFLSHGKNGLGAYMPDGTRQSLPTDTDEQENSDADHSYVSKGLVGTFDDQVNWVPPLILMHKMLSASRLP
ncbi:type II secretion system protein [Propionivibrio soli]|uniref:type II secretion system protein n=1 Tax=Propionivibrio soli TaxID=2976531 RepID=UPI0021E765FF|nr:type II secretion system protein [Propionivibrio soli]